MFNGVVVVAVVVVVAAVVVVGIKRLISMHGRASQVVADRIKTLMIKSGEYL
jgi:hypothetical protein